MLYDPKWETETKAKPSLAGLIAWLETKNPRARYQWHRNCVIHQYLDAMGFEYSSDSYFALEGEDAIALQRPHTFGALAERARAALAPAPSQLIPH